MKKELNIEGMHCMHCAEKVSKALSEVEEVKSVKVILDKKKAIVALNQDVEDAKLSKKIAELGFEVVSIKNKKFL